MATFLNPKKFQFFGFENSNSNSDGELNYEYCWMIPNLECNCTFLIDLTLNGILFGTKLIGKA